MLAQRLAPSATAHGPAPIAHVPYVLFAAALPTVHAHADAVPPVVTVQAPWSARPPVTFSNVNTPPTQVPPDHTLAAFTVEPVVSSSVGPPVGNGIINQTSAMEPAQPETDNAPVVPAVMPPDMSRLDESADIGRVALARAESVTIAPLPWAFRPSPVVEVHDHAARAPHILRAAPAPHAPLPLLIWFVGLTWLLMLRWQAVEDPAGSKTRLRAWKNHLMVFFFFSSTGKVNTTVSGRGRDVSRLSVS
jgi:hypothetical protein